MVIFVGFSGGGGGGSLKVYDNEVLVGDFDSLNYITAADEISIAPNDIIPTMLNVYHPAASLASEWTLNNGVEGSGIVPPESTQQRFVSVPTAEGNPFIASGWAGALHPVTRSNNLTYSPPGLVRFENNTTTTFTIVITYGDVEIYNVTTSPITGDGPYATPAGTVTITNEQANGPGRMANVSILIPISTHIPAGGYIDIELIHNNGVAAYSFSQELFYDSQTAESTQGAPLLALGAAVTYQTSGVHHLTTGTTFDVDIVDVDNFFRETTSTLGGDFSTVNLAVSDFTFNSSVFSTRQWDLNDATTALTATVNESNKTFCGDGNIQTRLFDWSYIATGQSANLSVLLCTKGASSVLVENFTDETYRVTPAYVAWDSTPFVVPTDLVIACGMLQRQGEDYTQFLPHGVQSLVNPDYTSTGAASQTYYRVFSDLGTARQNATLILTGLATETGIDIDFTINGTDWFDLKSMYAGGTLLAGEGAKVSGSGNTYDFTLSSHNTAVSGRIILRLTMTTAHELTGLTLTWS